MGVGSGKIGDCCFVAYPVFSFLLFTFFILNGFEVRERVDGKT